MYINYCLGLQPSRASSPWTCSVKYIWLSGSLAWKTSWTTGASSGVDGDERSIHVLKLDTLKTVKEVQVTDNSVAILRLQVGQSVHCGATKCIVGSLST